VLTLRRTFLISSAVMAAASGLPMAALATKDGTEIYYKDWGKGRPVVFSHGWPLSADAWEAQMFFLASNGYRCIAAEALAPPGATLGGD
jgi:hypothetical protein